MCTRSTVLKYYFATALHGHCTSYNIKKASPSHTLLKICLDLLDDGRKIRRVFVSFLAIFFLPRYSVPLSTPAIQAVVPRDVLHNLYLEDTIDILRSHLNLFKNKHQQQRKQKEGGNRRSLNLTNSTLSFIR